MRNLLILFATEVSQQPWLAYWEVLPAPYGWDVLPACSEVPTTSWKEATAGWEEAAAGWEVQGRATQRMEAAVAGCTRAATKRFARKKTAEKKRQVGPAFVFLEVKY
jgi:hypothetical protein